MGAHSSSSSLAAILGGSIGGGLGLILLILILIAIVIRYRRLRLAEKAFDFAKMVALTTGELESIDRSLPREIKRAAVKLVEIGTR